MLHQAEASLLQTIIDEARAGLRYTCILYPNNDSILLPDFVSDARKGYNAACQSTNNGDSNIGSMKPIDMVVLDGTYSHARRQLRHLEAMLVQYNNRHNTEDGFVPVKLPVVKLLLGKDGDENLSLVVLIYVVLT